MVFEAVHFFLHRLVDEIEVSHQLAIAELVNHSLEEAAHKASVLGHRVGFLCPFTELGSEGNSHGARRG